MPVVVANFFAGDPNSRREVLSVTYPGSDLNNQYHYGGQLVCPQPLYKLEPIGSLVIGVELDEPVHPLMIGPDLIWMVVSVHKLLDVGKVLWVCADWHTIWGELRSRINETVA